MEGHYIGMRLCGCTTEVFRLVNSIDYIWQWLLKKEFQSFTEPTNRRTAKISKSQMSSQICLGELGSGAISCQTTTIAYANHCHHVTTVIDAHLHPQPSTTVTTPTTHMADYSSNVAMPHHLKDGEDNMADVPHHPDSDDTCHCHCQGYWGKYNCPFAMPASHQMQGPWNKHNDIIMSPYKFTSKTHSLSTEDLGKFFIHSLIDSSFNTAGTFYLKQKNTHTMEKNH